MPLSRLKAFSLKTLPRVHDKLSDEDLNAYLTTYSAQGWLVSKMSPPVQACLAIERLVQEVVRLKTPVAPAPAPRRTPEPALPQVDLPPVKNVYAEVPERSKRRKIIQSLAPPGSDLKWYPELPDEDVRLWVVWRSGRFGVATYMSGHTFRLGPPGSGRYVNELPLAWCYLPIDQESE